MAHIEVEQNIPRLVIPVTSDILLKVYSDSTANIEQRAKQQLPGKFAVYAYSRQGFTEPTPGLLREITSTLAQLGCSGEKIQETIATVKQNFPRIHAK